MSRIGALTLRFSAAPRLYLQAMGGVQEPMGGRGRRYWVISRGLCRFFKVPLLPEAAAGKQRDALLLEIERLSPFAATGSHFDVGREFASVWLWDEEAVRVAAETIGVDVGRMRVLPETALQPEATDQARLVETLDGIEGQSWSGGRLAASRWWPAPPDDRAWMLFQRGASVAPDRISARPPDLVPLSWLDRPWTQSRAAGSLDLGRIDFRLAAASIAALIAIGYVYFGAEWMRLARDIHQTRTVIAERSIAIEPILSARTTALENEAAIRTLSQLDGYPAQLAVMARVAEILPRNDTHITDWSYDRGQLAVTVTSSQRLDALFFVRALQRIDGFTKVAADRANGDNSLRIRLAIDHK